MGLLRLHTLWWRLKTDGMLSVAKRVLRRVKRSSQASRKRGDTIQAQDPNATGETLDLQPGELVQIKSKEEIQRTLDSTGKCRGMGVMHEMWRFCGTRARVLKRVNKIVVESPNGADVEAIRKMRQTVLLEALNCDGGRLQCDRSCFFFWRESWLQRVPEVDEEPQSPHRSRTT
jgi:hypothetical protein